MYLADSRPTLEKVLKLHQGRRQQQVLFDSLVKLVLIAVLLIRIFEASRTIKFSGISYEEIFALFDT
ncbi:hypothetical protein F511_14507 [Dorcoceras hygrometricum]|uniref:Uncharacterized protein n=1 Tax=Dorcoceras hygrometricum TaxID=472368 RepID=A0A2Z7B410_9LAMI|nr:hypothetical protein F511_14507 [Dorcoceras hygrometricum]